MILNFLPGLMVEFNEFRNQKKETLLQPIMYTYAYNVYLKTIN